MADPPDGKPPPAFDIPDLDLALPSRPAPDAVPPPAVADAPGPLETAGAAAGGAAAPGSLDYFGHGAFDADDFDDPRQDGAALLDLADIPTGGVAGAPREEERWPSGCSPERGALAIDAPELAEVAGYGPPPKALYLAPAYAWRVLSRQRALRADLERVEAELSTAERARNRLLGGMVETVAPALEADERMGRVMEPVRRLDAVARERGATLASTDAEYRRQVAMLDTERTAIQQQADAQRAVVEQHRAGLEQRDEAFRRVEARFKRSQIELRNAQQAAMKAVEASGPGTAVPPEHASRIQQIHAQAASIQPELEQRQNERASAQAGLTAAERQLAELERALRGVDSRRRALDQQFGSQLETQTHDVERAELERESALGDAGRAVLAARGAIPLDPAVLAQIRNADENVDRLARRAETRLRALDVHDRDAVRRGFTLVVALAGMVVIVIVLAVTL
jgi:hypothetical protein